MTLSKHGPTFISPALLILLINWLLNEYTHVLGETPVGYYSKSDVNINAKITCVHGGVFINMHHYQSLAVEPQGPCVC